ncbi:glycine betaine ABC transporter substrate-binding protein [Rhizobium sp. ARZ01]|uniref:ABC transporter substrate-binding protein n=1 Tax=Rhizobium sp. ARZ01 TaxID=2769313 RepID=UPI0032B10C0E
MLNLTFAATLFAAFPSQAADLVISAPNWPSGQATANILKVGIEKAFGLQADVQPMGTMTSFAGLETGVVDVQPEVWRPNFDALVKKYVDEKGVMALAGKSVSAWQGLCATSEAAKTMKTVADLSDPEKTKVLDTDGDGRGEMWIGAPSWLSTGIERVRAHSYGYASTLALVEAEEDVAMAAVDAAVATGQPMVFYCYAPHHVFGLHELIRIEEPPHDPAKWQLVSAQDPLWIEKSSAATAWDTAHFQIAYRTAFAKERPEVAHFLDKVDLSPEEVTQMSYALGVERQEPLVYAQKWVEQNAARVDGWAKP